MRRDRVIRPMLEPLEARELLTSDIGLLDVTTADFQMFDVRYAIAGENAPALTFRAYLSADEHLDMFDVALPSDHLVTRVEDLTAGTTHQTTMTLAARAPVSDGRRFMIVAADPDSVLEPIGGPSRADNVLFAVPLFAPGQTADQNGKDGAPETGLDASGPFTGAILPGTADSALLVATDLRKVWTGSTRLSFGYTMGESLQWQRDEDQFAQETIVAPLTQLVKLIDEDLARAPGLWGDAVFSINEAYDSLHQHAVPESLHYEGRALDLGLPGRPVGGPEVARLAGLSWLAGFDWVYHENDHIHVSEHAAFATSINQTSLQQSVLDAYRLNRIESRLVTSQLVGTLDGLDRALQNGRALEALSKLLEFRSDMQAAAGGAIRDTGFVQLLLLNVDRLTGRILDGLQSLPGAPPEGQPHTETGAGQFVGGTEFILAGTATHLGRFEATGNAWLSPTDNPAVFRIKGWVIDTAANGDRLFEFFLGGLNALTGKITATVGYIGGTGRFTNASGAGVLSAALMPDGSIDYATDGSINYGHGDVVNHHTCHIARWRRRERRLFR